MHRPPALVPELSVEQLDRSLAFWCGVCGFVVDYGRPDEGFARIGLDGAVVMLDQLGVGRDWITARLERPLGRGINLEIRVADVDAVRERIRTAGILPRAVHDASEAPAHLEPPATLSKRSRFESHEQRGD